MFKKLSNILNNLGHSPSKKSYSKVPQSGFDFLSLIDRWEEIVGERLIKMTIPLKHQYGNLVILTSHPAIGQQLSFMEEELKKRIVEVFPSLKGKIKSIRYQMNSSFFEKKTEESQKRKETFNSPKIFHPYSPEFRKYKKEADELFADVEDEEVKKSLTSLYIQGKHLH